MKKNIYKYKYKTISVLLKIHKHLSLGGGNLFISLFQISKFSKNIVLSYNLKKEILLVESLVEISFNLRFQLQLNINIGLEA